MREFLPGFFASGSEFSAVEVLVRLLMAMVLGFTVSWIYRGTRAKQEVTRSFQTTLVLLAILIAMVTQVIGDSVARAFSLVGALSIVRFRTVVRDTQDTAYVIFAVVVGMAAGSTDPRVAVIGICVVGVAALLTMPRERVAAVRAEVAPEFLLSMRLTLGTELESLAPTLDRHVADRHLRSFGTVRQGATLEAVYGVRLRADGSPTELVGALNQIEGVQSVGLAQAGSV